MAKIKEIVTIHSGYAQYINLVQTFNDPTENRGRMEHYMPIKSHREAFTRLSRALYPLDNRVYFLTGSYGTGKSHLCLMLANYLSLKPNDVEMVQFFENWKQRDPDGGEKLHNLRGEGRYLLALCEYGGGDDFDSMILRSIQAAIEREELQDAWLDTHFQEAVRQVDRWEARSLAGQASGAFSDFQKELATRYPDFTLDSLKQDLNNFSQEALNAFREIFRVVVGSEFSYSKDNLVPILEDFLSNQKFKTRYKGLVIIADEFGYVLDRGNIRIDVFQRFAEMCQAGVAGSQLIFIGTGHKPFPAYSAGGLSTSDFKVVEARMTEVPLESEELELIIASIVVPKKDHPLWKSKVESQAGMFNRFALTAGRIGMFNHLKGPEVRSRIVEDIYPMHPMATHSLTEMSTEIGSNARSIFRFFSSAVDSVPVEGSYKWFVETEDIESGDRINLFTADQLITYFEDELKPDNPDAREAIRQHIRNYRISQTDVRKQAQAELIQEVDHLVERTLKILLVYEISKVAPTFDNLAFGLYCETPAEKSQLQNRLDTLVNSKVLFQSPTGLYEFRQAGQGIEFDERIEAYKTDPDNLPESISEEVMTLVSLGRGGSWLEAKNYNQPYDEDKRLLRIFAQPGDLFAKFQLKETGEEVNFFDFQEAQLLNVKEWKDRYEGAIVYVLCESDEDVQRARESVENNQSENVIVGIPHQSIPIREAIMNLRAALHIRDIEDLDAMTLQDRSRLQEDYIGDERRGTGYIGEFIRIRSHYLEAKDLSWYGLNGSVFVAQPKTEYDPADELMGRIYEERNKVPHPYLNQIHVSRFGPGKDAPLSDAIAALLRSHRDIEIDHSAAANRGEIRYLKNVFADYGAIKQKGPAQGSLAQYDIETSPNKFQEKLPALAAMLKELQKLDQGESLQLRKLLNTHIDAPFGQGPIALSLFLAYCVRSFGDELRLQLQPGAVGYVAMTDPDLILALVEGQNPNAIFERQTISKAAHDLINEMFNLFTAEPGAVGQKHTVNEAYGVIRDWWNQQANLAKASEVYPEDSTVASLVNLLRNIEGINPYRLILEQIQFVYGYAEDAVITNSSREKILEGLKQDKDSISNATQRIKDTLLKKLMAPFNPESDFYSDYQTAIENWYKNLGDEQKDEFASWHSNSSRALVQRLRTIVNIDTTFFDQLPKDLGFGLGSVDDWHRDRSDEYVQMMQAALERVKANRVKVPAPVWSVSGKNTKQLETERNIFQVTFRQSTTLEVKIPEDGVEVLLTNTNEDPRTAQQKEVIGKDYKLSIKKGCVVKLASQAIDGTFGQVITLSFINEDNKYEVTPMTQDGLFEREYKFVYPKDKDAIEVLLISILKDVIKRDLISEKEAEQLLKDVTGKLKDLY